MSRNSTFRLAPVFNNERMVWLSFGELGVILDSAADVGIYEKFKNIYADAPGYPHVRGKVAAAEIDDSLVEGKLDKKLYQSVASQEAWAYMAELLDGKRESYRRYLDPLTRPIR